jgi:hypothetical protein
LDTHGGSVNTQILNNIIANSEGYGIYQCTADQNFGNLEIDHNLYYNTGWRAQADGGVYQPGLMAVRIPTGQLYYPTLGAVQSHPYHWELSGVVGNPGFAQYDANDHDPYDGSWPNFHLTAASDLAIDASGPLPASLEALIQHFGIVDGIVGEGRDLGWQESDGFFLAAVPAMRAIDPGGEAVFALELQTVGQFASEVTLTATNPDPRFDVVLSPTSVQPDAQVSLTLTDRASSGPAGTYTVRVTAVGGGMTRTVDLGVVVVDSRVYLPVTVRR